MQEKRSHITLVEINHKTITTIETSAYIISKELVMGYGSLPWQNKAIVGWLAKQTEDTDNQKELGVSRARFVGI
jgi:hypothetical protein